jgi:hypothetical protein
MLMGKKETELQSRDDVAVRLCRNELRLLSGRQIRIATIVSLVGLLFSRWVVDRTHSVIKKRSPTISWAAALVSGQSFSRS